MELTISQIRQLLENPKYDSADDLIKAIRHLPDGFGFFNLTQTDLINPILESLLSLPPHAEYDLDMKHFNAGTLPMKFASEALHNLIQNNQNLVGFFGNESLNWISEAAFIRSRIGQSRKSKPLILHFCSRLDSAISQQSSILRSDYGSDFDLIHVGPQFHCSEREAIEAVTKAGDKIAFLPTIQQVGVLRSLENLNQIDGQRSIWIRFNLNSLSESEGGDSRSWPTGICIKELLSVFEILYRQAYVQGMTLGPFSNLTADDLSCRTGAQMLSNFVYAASYRKVISRFHGQKS